MKKKMANPTLLLSFPNKNYFEIELTNPTLEIFTVTLGIVHQ